MKIFDYTVMINTPDTDILCVDNYLQKLTVKKEMLSSTMIRRLKSDTYRQSFYQLIKPSLVFQSVNTTAIQHFLFCKLDNDGEFIFTCLNQLFKDASFYSRKINSKEPF